MPAVDLIGAMLLCLVVATGLVFFDLNRKIVESGTGTAPISYMADGACWIFALIIGGGAVGIFLLTRSIDLATPSRGWSLLGRNLYGRAFIVGLASIVILRSKIAEINGNTIGLDYIYEGGRTWAIGVYKKHAARLSGQYVIRVEARMAAIEDFDAHLIRMLTSAVDARGARAIATLRKDIATLSPSAAAYGNLTYSAKLLHLSIEHIGLAATKAWCAGHARIAASRGAKVGAAPS
jgi:hypothetical protein